MSMNPNILKFSGRVVFICVPIALTLGLISNTAEGDLPDCHPAPSMSCEKCWRAWHTAPVCAVQKTTTKASLAFPAYPSGYKSQTGTATFNDLPLGYEVTVDLQPGTFEFTDKFDRDGKAIKPTWGPEVAIVVPKDDDGEAYKTNFASNSSFHKSFDNNQTGSQLSVHLHRQVNLGTNLLKDSPLVSTSELTAAVFAYAQQGTIALAPGNTFSASVDKQFNYDGHLTWVTKLLTMLTLARVESETFTKNFVACVALFISSCLMFWVYEASPSKVRAGFFAFTSATFATTLLVALGLASSTGEKGGTLLTVSAIFYYLAKSFNPFPGAIGGKK